MPSCKAIKWCGVRNLYLSAGRHVIAPQLSLLLPVLANSPDIIQGVMFGYTFMQPLHLLILPLHLGAHPCNVVTDDRTGGEIQLVDHVL